MVQKEAPAGVDQRRRDRACGAAIWCSRLFFLASAGLFLLCCLRLAGRFFFPAVGQAGLSGLAALAPPVAADPLNRAASALSGRLAACYGGLLNWCAAYLPKEAASPIFLAVGLVNFSYSYIVASRERALHGIRLHEVMHALFPWYGAAYVLHGAWVVAGLYCSASDAPLMTAACLAGVFFVFVSTGVVMFLFHSDHHRQQMMAEYYLCRFGESTSLWLRWRQRSTPWPSAMAYMLQAASYVRQYYLATQRVPEAVAQAMWKRLLYKPSPHGLPTAYLEEKPAKKKTKEPAAEEPAAEAQLGDLYDAARQIIQLRRVWQRMLEDLPPDKQADLIRQTLRAVARSCPCDVDPNTFWRRDGGQSGGARVFFGLPLCALVSFLLDQERPAPTAERYWKGWEHCVGCVFLASNAHLGELEDNQDTRKYQFLVQQLFVLTAAALIAECSVLRDSDLAGGNTVWRQIGGLSEKLRVPLFWTGEYFLWGRCITLTSTDERFSAPQGLDVEQTYDVLREILGCL